MKRFLIALIMAAAYTISIYAQSGYIVSTNTKQNSSTIESPEKRFIDDHFKYYNLCDWTPGMKFMVIPERKDMIIPTFKSAENDKDIDSGVLKYKIMEYLGTEITERGAIHFNFDCEGKQYYHEVKNITLNQYCMKPKAGIPTLAYLGDVDIAKDVLEGTTLYMRTNKVRVDDANSTNGFREVPINLNEKVTVTAIGVGSRAFPVKIVFSDSKGNTYYQPVAISKTNCGMVDADFIMENKNKYFPNSFSFSDANAKKSEDLMSQYGKKVVYLKAATDCTDETDNEVKLPRYTQFIVNDIIAANGTPYVTLVLAASNNKIYKYKVTFTHTNVVNTILRNDSYFADIFGIGNLRTKYPQITSELWEIISNGEVRKGMSTDECRLALGDPIRVHIVAGGFETWYYERKTLDFTNKKLERIL